ncbi:MAG TPA: class I SAM-dependent methyltransferase [Gaiellaceae bacterium]|nr:class I SAM-dependent methyltransferase [Gaiellaceae bacterium]
MKDSSASRKPATYFAQERPELVAQLPVELGRVLDVGCGSGGVGRAIRPHAVRLVGVELDEEAAAAARATYDDVLVGDVVARLPELDEQFDTILAYDVLEHLPDPLAALRTLRTLAAPNALLHVSVPNARHFSLVRDLVFRGTFGYTEWGHRDSTHLRWLTRRDLVDLLEAAGWSVERTAHAELSPAGRFAERVTRGLSADFLVHQWSALARAK